MAAVGTQAKQQITQKILEVFEGSFLYDNGKEIRIPILEDGVLRQIKVSLTCAKVNVEAGSDNALPVPAPAISNGINFEDLAPGETIAKRLEPTQEEKDNIAAMLASLGL